MFLDRTADRQRLPITLLSGFLGSGKTTLVNALLRDPRLRDTAVAINEFGEVPLDQLLVDNDRDATVVLANGCLCCNLAGDMEGAVMRLFARRQSGDLPSFRRLIVEPSGLADPAPIAQAILRNPVMSRALRLAAIITTVDALFAESQTCQQPEFNKQVALADTVVLTKSDMVDEQACARAISLVRDLNPAARVLRAVQGKVDVADLLPGCFLDPAEPDDPPPRDIPPAAPLHHHAHAASISLTAEKPLRWREFEAFLRDVRLSLGQRLLRVKGIIDVVEAAGPVVVQGVHHVLHAPVALECWPDSDRRTRIVLILQRSDADWITARWLDLLQDSPGMTTSSPAVSAGGLAACAP